MQIKTDEKGASGQIILSHHLKNILWTEHHRLLPNNKKLEFLLKTLAVIGLKSRLHI